MRGKGDKGKDNDLKRNKNLEVNETDCKVGKGLRKAMKLGYQKLVVN